MTKKQIYSALAAIAAHGCYDGKKFVRSGRVGKEALGAVQKKIRVLLEKLDYQRTQYDFRDLYRDGVMPSQRIHEVREVPAEDHSNTAPPLTAESMRSAARSMWSHVDESSNISVTPSANQAMDRIFQSLYMESEVAETPIATNPFEE